MKRSLLLAPIVFVLGALAAPTLPAQTPAGSGKGQGQQDRLRKRDGSCLRDGHGRGARGRDGARMAPGAGRGQGVRKQDGTGPRAGTPACPKTPKAPAK